MRDTTKICDTRKATTSAASDGPEADAADADARLDEALEETFPASDPIALARPGD